MKVTTYNTQLTHFIIYLSTPVLHAVYVCY